MITITCKKHCLRDFQDKDVHFHPLIQHILNEVLANIIRSERKIKGILIGKEEMKLFLFGDYIKIYIDDPKESIL